MMNIIQTITRLLGVNLKMEIIRRLTILWLRAWLKIITTLTKYFPGKDLGSGTATTLEVKFVMITLLLRSLEDMDKTNKPSTSLGNEYEVERAIINVSGEMKRFRRDNSTNCIDVSEVIKACNWNMAIRSKYTNLEIELIVQNMKKYRVYLRTALMSNFKYNVVA